MSFREAYLAKKEADEKRKALITKTVKTCDETEILDLLDLRPVLTEAEKLDILQNVVRKCVDISLIETLIEAFGIDLTKLHKSKPLVRFFSSNPVVLKHFMAKEELVPLFKQGIDSLYSWDVTAANMGRNEPDARLQPLLSVLKEFMDRHGIADTTHRNPEVRAKLDFERLVSLCNKQALNEAIDRVKARPPSSKYDMHRLFNIIVHRCTRTDIGEYLGRFIDELNYVPDNFHTSFTYISENKNALKYLLNRPEFVPFFKRHIKYAYEANIKHILDRSGPNISSPIKSPSYFTDYQEFMKSQKIPFAQPNDHRRNRIAADAKEQLISRAERLARDENRIVTRRLTYDQEQRAINAAESGREYSRRFLVKWREMQANPKAHNRRVDLDLMYGAIKCDVGKIRAALSKGASTTAVIKGTGSIPLAYFITNCRLPFGPGSSFTEDQKEMVEMLMRGVNDDPEILCSLDHFGRSLLELAIIAGNNGMAYILITETDFVNFRPDIAQMIYDHAEGRVINDFGYGTYYGRAISHIIAEFLKVKLSYIPEEVRKPADIRRVAEAAAEAARRAPAATAVQEAMAAAREEMKEQPLEAKVTPESLTITEYTEPEAEAEKAISPSPEVEAAINATVSPPDRGGGGGSGDSNTFNGLGLNNAGLINLSLFNESAATAEPKKNTFNALLARAAAKGITLPPKLTKKKYERRLKDFLNALSENNSNSSSNSEVNVNKLGGGGRQKTTKRRTLKAQKRR